MRFFTTLGILVSIFLAGNSAYAQLPTCTGAGGFVYIKNGTQIWNWDPFQPLSATNPVLNTIACPSGSEGLAVANNINGPGPSPTFYVQQGGTYRYWDGATWVNTGHVSSSVNIGGGGPYVYGLVGGAVANVYRYDGTGNDVFVTAIPGFNNAPYDIVGDNQGNFYILSPGSGWINKYDPLGNLMTTYPLVGVAPTTSAGGGYAIVNGRAVWHNNNGYVSADIDVNCDFQNFPISGPISPTGTDWASCEIDVLGGSISMNLDTYYYCPGGDPVMITVNGTGPYTWTVLSGNMVITGTGDTVYGTASSTVSTFVVTTSAGGCGGSGSDTGVFIVPVVVPNAGPDDTTFGCGTYLDTLTGLYFGNPNWLNYNVSWTPAGQIVSGGNTTSPVVSPTAPSTTFVMTVSTNASQGGCSWRDSTVRYPHDASVVPNFSYNIKWGCDEDTVEFTNLSQFHTKSTWHYGNGITDNAENPTYIYNTQGNYNVKLVVNNSKCYDSITQNIDLNHPLDASFTVDNDSVCQGTPITFTNTSVTTVRNGIDPVYFWDFGNGDTMTAGNPIYTFTKTGTYTVTIYATDYVPCTDSFKMTLVVDSVPHAFVIFPDTAMCEGEAITFTADFLDIGNTEYWWEFGDGTSMYNVNPVAHAYDTNGVFNLTFHASYRICDDASDDATVIIKPQPRIDLGEDLYFCPNAEPLFIVDNINGWNPDAIWRWTANHGGPEITETGSSIRVTHQGLYSGTVKVDGCYATDSVMVYKDCYLDIPNAFSPNEDGMNDYFLPRQLLSRGVTKFDFNIFNRWGEKVYYTDKIDGRGWDGKYNGVAQPAGVYIYTIEVHFKNDGVEKYQGNVTMIR